MIRRAFLLPAVFALAACAYAEQKPQTYYLINNFAKPLPSTDQMRCSVEEADVEVGVAAARIRYQVPAAGGTVQTALQQEEWPPQVSGRAALWVKGDGSGNELLLRWAHAEQYVDDKGNRQYRNLLNETFEPIVLNFQGWVERSLPVQVPAGRVAWLSDILIRKPNADAGRATGEILLDDLRLYPADDNAPSFAMLDLDGPAIRPYDETIRFVLQAANFSTAPATVSVRITMTDRSDVAVADRRFDDVPVGGGEYRETKLSMQPENLHLRLPPFTIKAELSSPDISRMPSFAGKLVMGNSWLLFDDFSNVFGRWFTSGMGFFYGGSNQLFGEMQRACARTQTNARISRVEIEKPADPAQPAPPGRYAMKIDYSSATMIYNGLERYLPGDAYRMGMWVYGDGSGAELNAAVLDFAAAGSPFSWATRHFGGCRICILDFEGWRYFECPLPGNGLGPRTARGSTDAVDFPLDLSAIAIIPKPAQAPRESSIRVGPIFIHTQQTRSEAISVQVGYDDPNHEYAPALNAWAAVQNGWRISDSNVSATWSLCDRDNDELARGRQDVHLKPMEMSTFKIDLAACAQKIANAAGPLRLRVIATDTREMAAAEAQIILSKPDSTVLASDFEAERGYLALQAWQADRPGPTRQAATTSTEQKHSGNRSLAMRWRKGEPLFVSIDPPLAGQPVSISMWVYGDGSNVLLYPLIGDAFGVVSSMEQCQGLEQCQWDLFLPRTDGALQNAVKIDWAGWREVTFRLPTIPPSWDKAQPVLPFVPSYPLGLHLAIQPPDGVGTGQGVVYIDDVRVRTHLPLAERLAIRLEQTGESNITQPGGVVRAAISNYATPGATASGPRKALVTGGLFDWRNRRVNGADIPVEVAPGAMQTVEIARNVEPGAYALQVKLKDGNDVIGSIAGDLLVMNPAAVLGDQWQKTLYDPVKLNIPLKNRYTLVRHDWDWTEFQPGNVQVDTLLTAAGMARRASLDPYMLLGFSAYWAASSGYDAMLADLLSTRINFASGMRDWGHAVDIFQTPARLDDWENYVCEMMRLAGPGVAGWVLWDSPDNPAFVGVQPGTFARMIRMTEKWRRRYCPGVPLIIGGLSRATAIGYLGEVTTNGWLDTRYAEIEDFLERRAPSHAIKPMRKTLERPAAATPAAPANAPAGFSDREVLDTREAVSSHPTTEATFEQRSAVLRHWVPRLQRQLQDAGVAGAEVLGEILDEDPLSFFSGVNVRIDAGRLSPEDNQLSDYIDDIHHFLCDSHTGDKSIIVTDLDWAVETTDQGLDAFDQAAFLARAALLLNPLNVQPVLMLHNEDTARAGFGLSWRESLTIPPMTVKLPAFQFKPGWLAMMRLKQFLSDAQFLAEIPVQDIIPGGTRCMLFERRADRKPAVMVWRTGGEGGLSFASTGLKVEASEDIFGARVPLEDNCYSIGRMPASFVLAGEGEPVAEALSRLLVRNGTEAPAWPQTVLATFTHRSGGRWKYEQAGGRDASFAGRTTGYRPETWPGLEFPKGGSERFETDVPQGAGLVLRKRYFLGDTKRAAKAKQPVQPGTAAPADALDVAHLAGHTAEVIVNGKSLGTWDLSRMEEDLSGGPRQAVYVIGAEALGGAARAAVEIRYAGVANSAGWSLYACRNAEFPLSALGAIHADSRVASPRPGRNVAGLPLRIGTNTYANGIGAFAPCVIDYPINGQFRQFTAVVGVDAATEGRGSVVFEVHGDGRKLWNSPVVTGLDKPREVSVDITKVNRLRLIVADGGDGNRFDAANWCNATLRR